MKKKIIFLSIFILVLLLGGVAIYYFTMSNGPTITYADTQAKYKTETKPAPTDGSLPIDHDSYSNIAYVLWVLEHTERYSSTTRGTAVSVGQTQVIYNVRRVNGKEQLVDTVSDGLVTVGKQKYFIDGKVLLRDFVSRDGDNIEWKQEEPECITNKGYIKRYGWLPTQATAYIICKDTILEISETTALDNGLYSITLVLNPDMDYAPYYYQREIATNASSLVKPEFYSIKLEYIFDANWVVQEVRTQEQYMVKPKVAPIPVTSDTNIVEVFDYENYEFDASAMDYFNQYKDLKPSDGEVTPSETTPLSYITGSLLGDTTKDKTFDVKIEIEDQVILGKLSLNISDLNNIGVKVSLGDLQIVFDSDVVYIDYGTTKLKCNINEVGAVLEPLIQEIVLKNLGKPSLDLSNSLNVNQIMQDLNTATVVENENSVQLTTVLNLMGITLPLDFNIAKNGNDLDLLSISSNIDVLGTTIQVFIEK
ncbi:MAG: hypothetical protein K2K15_04715, partial [Anaeroplasmataceae bacterium]|nr:hypothetical protein [Anaeroplasmataceae bacterium]